MTLPWAQSGSRLTNPFEALAIDARQATNIKKPAKIQRTNWDEARRLVEWAVIRGGAAKRDAIPTLIGLDEKVIAKGHRYVTLMCDLEESHNEYIG